MPACGDTAERIVIRRPARRRIGRSGYQTGGRRYQVQVQFRASSGDAYVAALYELQAVEVLGD